MQSIFFKINNTLNYIPSFKGVSKPGVNSSATKTILPVLEEDKFEKQIDKSDDEYKKNIQFLIAADCIDINDLDDEFQKFFPTLYHLPQVSLKNINKIPQIEKQYANAVVNRETDYMRTVHTAERIAEALQETLDLQFGKNNYSMLGVGRSPSPITQIMKFNGVKADSVPFTYNKYYNKSLVESDIDWKKYLAKFGFDKKNLTDKNKKTILTDYALSGATLDVFKQILDKIYPDNNVICIDLISLPEMIPEKLRKKYNLQETDFQRFQESVKVCDYKFTICTCGHLRFIDDYKNYAPKTVNWPLLAKVILLDYLCKK